MRKITFIVNKDCLYKYIYKTINSLLIEYPDLSVDIYADVKLGIDSNHINYLRYLNQVDRRFNSYKMNPFDFVDFKFLNHPRAKIIYDVKDITMSDWLVVPDISNYESSFYNDIVKNGKICLDLEINQIIHYCIDEKQNVDLPLKVKRRGSAQWELISTMKISMDKGVLNSIFKFVWYRQIAFFKFLRNSNNYPILEIAPKNGTFPIFKFLKYYSVLIKKIVSRKASKMELNWKIGLQKLDKDYVLLDQPKNSFWADPFIIIENEEIFIFIEELNSESNLGEIACVKLNDSFEILEKKTILKGKTHFSFPNVFYHKGGYYMIPENSANNSLDLYEATCFPYEWKFKKILIDNIKLIDCIWLFYENKYWIFGNKINVFENDNNDNLYLYYSDNLFGNDWSAHKQNPIVSDSSKARNAGNIFIKDGKLFRPSQNCSKSYGANLVINEVLELNTENYSEKISERIFPQEEFIGMHTLNYKNDIHVCDFLKIEKRLKK